MKRIVVLGPLALATLLSAGLFAALPGASSGARGVDTIAQGYVKLVLALGQHDADYVDAYYGPAEWQTQAATAKKPLEQIAKEAARLRGDLAKAPAPADEMSRLRLEYLTKQLSALEARVGIVQGKRMKFDEESR